ncbi:MAG: hypothetical protein ACRD45_20505 [Bryobacteraceae bacterium]
MPIRKRRRIFKQPADNARTLHKVFQEEGWHEYLDDPLPGGRVDAVKRLQDAVFALNGTLRNGTLRNGTLRNAALSRAALSTVDRPASSVPFHIDESGERLRCQLARITPPDAGRRAPRAGWARLVVG